MLKMKRLKFFAVVAVGALILAFFIPRYISSAGVVTPTGIATSGFIEATSVNIAAETGGRVKGITVSEGDRVAAGELLVRLDGSLLTAQRQQAEINLILAKASVTQATLAQENARKAWENARDVQLKIAEINLEGAQSAFSKITYPYTYSTFAFDVPAAIAAVNEAQLHLAEAGKWLAADPASGNYPKAIEGFRLALDNLTTAQERLTRGEGADVFLQVATSASGTLKPGKTTSDFWTLRTAQLEMEKAQLSVQSTTAGVDQAHTTYLQATNGIEIAAGQTKLAEAALNLIDVQLGKLTLSSPINGVVAAKNIEEGEIAGAGTPILTVTQLENVTLTTYVPESQIGLVMLGQKVLVAIDSYPGQEFTGQVIFISPRAAFTPGNIQLKDEREKTVFAVKISLSNPDSKLKPGMPADATIITASQR
jgi:HlyD family secretion protein